MNAKLRIGIRLYGVGTFDIKKPGNVQGDEQVARSWQKYLLRRDDVDTVLLYGPTDTLENNLHVVIHFNPFLDLHATVPNILYLQNAFPKEFHPGGTVGVFESVQMRFNGYIFTSQTLMNACASGAVIPFATDPEMLFPHRSEIYAHPVCFVGNDIRGPIINHRYFLPALPFGLVIYGNNVWSPPLSSACRGKLPMEDLPKVYSSALINLNAHIDEHVIYDTINLRIFDVLACGGFVISDRTPSLSSWFGDAVVCTDGGEDLWAKLVRYLTDSEERKKRSAIGRRIVLDHHTYAQRVETLMTYLHNIL